MKNNPKNLGLPAEENHVGYRLSWRDGQLKTNDQQDHSNGGLISGTIILNTNPDIRDFAQISKIEFRDLGGRGMVEVFANDNKCAILEYDGHAHYWVEIKDGKVDIAATGNRGHFKTDIKNKDLCRFVDKQSKDFE